IRVRYVTGVQTCDIPILTLVVFGHMGDGNLHPNILCNENDPEELRRVEKAIEEIFHAALELDGTLSGEHGIGTMKSPFLEKELRSEERRVGNDKSDIRAR